LSERSFLGLTWDHPRGYVALEKAAAQARAHGLTLHWKRHPLEGFESHPIEELARQYDLIVLDHPHIGDAVAGDCLQPLESLFDLPTLDAWKAQSIGNTFESYRYGGKHWALPLDAASQVAAFRPDRVDEAAPATWSATLELARRHPVVLSLAGPHAVLTLFSISTAHGDAPAAFDPGRLFAGPGVCTAWEVMRELHALSFKGWADRNPIAILEGLASDAQAVYCPLVYGYVNYAVAVGDRHAVSFVDVPAGPDGRLGSVLGGTGLAVSQRTAISEKLREHLVALLSDGLQRDFIPFADGQPSARAAWSDTRVNAAWRGFFAQTRATVERAIVRPRHPHYVPFQTAAAEFVRQALAHSLGPTEVVNGLQALYDSHRPVGSEV
jgi:multiple sugar transport system substrate-binding protein